MKSCELPPPQVSFRPRSPLQCAGPEVMENNAAPNSSSTPVQPNLSTTASAASAASAPLPSSSCTKSSKNDAQFARHLLFLNHRKPCIFLPHAAAAQKR